MVRDKLKKIFTITVEIVFGIILMFLMLGIAMGAVQLSASIWNLFKLKGITGNYIHIITDVLTLYVLVELSRSLVEYFHSHKLRLTFVVDGGIVFILREILIGLFKHSLEPKMIYALSLLLFVLGALRISSVLVYQREQGLLENIEDK